jgi:hypothetical protein
MGNQEFRTQTGLIEANPLGSAFIIGYLGDNRIENEI